MLSLLGVHDLQGLAHKQDVVVRSSWDRTRRSFTTMGKAKELNMGGTVGPDQAALGPALHLFSSTQIGLFKQAKKQALKCVRTRLAPSTLPFEWLRPSATLRQG